MKKLTALFTALLMTLLVGCGEGGKAAKLVAVEEDAKSFNYSVVRPKGCSEDIEAAAKEIRSKLRKTYGVSVTVSYGEEKDYDGNYEILIGNTGRAESEEALKRLKENRENCQFDFIIKTVGEKLCITALRDEMTARAAEYFAETYCADKSGWEKLNSQTELIYEAPFKAHPHKIGGTELRNFTVVTVRDMEYIYGREIENTVNYLSGSQGYELAVTDERSPEVKNEILIGERDRAASKKVSAESGGWIIKATDGKLVIKGADSLCLADAVSHFLQMLKEKENADSYIELPADYELKGKPESSGGYSLVWNDEFDQKSLNNHWWVDYSSQNTYGATSNSCLGGTVTQKAAENTKMTGDGCLTIFSTRNGKDFTEGSVSTWETLQLKYGLIEFRAKLPAEPGCGTLWFNGSKLGYACMTEYDLLENFGSAKSFASNLHRWWLQNNGTGHTSLDIPEYSKLKRYNFSDSIDPNADLSTDFHIYTMEWDESKVSFAVDGKVYFSYSLDATENPDSRRLPVYMIMSCGMGSADYGVAATDSSPEYVEMKVDYVRIYQRSDNGSKLLTRDKNNIPNLNNRDMSRYVGGKRVS